MNLITSEHLSHTFTDKKILDDVAFHLESGDKLGIIGKNGAGKSTLLHILNGDLTPDTGSITMGRNIRIAFLEQNPTFPDSIDVLTAALPLADDISAEPSAYEADARSLLTKLGINNLSQSVSELSGGQRKRIALVRTLLTPADIWILDEPTNHLDSEMSNWLEERLIDAKQAIIMITHDRYFLDRVTNAILELDQAKLYRYDCNYMGYLQRKAEREDIALATQRKQQTLLRKEIAWIQRGARARSTKQKAHIARYEALQDIELIPEESQVNLQSVSSRLGKSTITLDHISKAYGSHTLIQDFSYSFLRDDHIGIIGPNGCGKSTLLKIIMKKINPDSGTLDIGQTVKIGYFSQESEELDNNERAIDYIREGAEWIETPEGKITASAMLERFLFEGSLQYAPIGKLSGGEKRRLYLARILMEAPNVLILDEPTNDLDIPTLSILEDYLDHFDGIIITVSHDRYFLNRIVRRIFAYEGNGHLIPYEGDYNDYLTKSKENTQSSIPANTSSPAKTEQSTDRLTSDESAESSRGKHQLRMTYQEQKDYQNIESDIAALEENIDEHEKAILQAATDFVLLNRLSVEKTDLEQQLEEKMARWVYLEDLAEKTQK